MSSSLPRAIGGGSRANQPPDDTGRSLGRDENGRHTRQNRGMDIPGAHSPSLLFEGGSTASDSADGLFQASTGSGGGLSLSYGTSPGHGLGYLMRPRLDGLAGTVNDDIEQGSLHMSIDVNSPLADDGKTFTLAQEDLTAPLLSRGHLAGVDSEEAAVAAVKVEGPPPTQALRAIVFGLINATAGIPALIAYAAIVFRDPIYAPYVDLLCKFFFLSSALHQTIFCLFSSLPFAMGQVQDVGIIFLSAMGTSIAALTLEAGRDAETALGTALLTMTVSTFLVGLGTLFVARKSLAQFVQYIPLPVMGGYLAFVGYFCIASGVGLGVSVEISSLTTWAGLFARLPLIKLVPTVLSCVAMILTLEKARHPLALPTVLLSLVGIFHVVLYTTGITLEDAQKGGWVMPPAAHEVEFWKLWDLFHIHDWSLSGIYLPAIWRQVAKAAGLLLVVIFGSCMDIAAIQQDVPFKIDFNHELTTVAISNMVTGVTGVGYTGSYIFSQTVFTMRAGVYSRINGWVIAGAEFLVFALPGSIVQYVPNYFLGALLLWFGVEISRDWLFLSYFKLTLVEYGLLWLTFASIMQFGLEGGIAAGIVFATLYFAYAYARSQVENFRADRARSSVVRTVEHQAALDLLWGSHAVTAQLRGFVFFGSAQSMGTKLQEAATRLAGPGDSAHEERQRLEDAILGTMRSTGEDYSGEKHEQALAALAVAPKFLVVDLSMVTGMDSSGARTVADTVRELGGLGITAILTGAAHDGILSLLTVHDLRLRAMRWPPELHPPRAPPGTNANPLDAASQDHFSLESESNLGEVLPIEESSSADPGEPEAFCFPNLEEGLRFCEDALLEVAVQFGLCTPPGAGTTLKECLISHLEKLPLTAPKNAEAMTATLRRYMGHRTVRRGEVLWQPDDPAEELYVVEKGVIRVDQFKLVGNEDGRGHLHGVIRSSGRPNGGLANGGGAHANKYSVKVRSFELGPGCVAGSTDFYLARPHGTRAVCASGACRMLWLSRAAMAKMAIEAPAALNVLQMAIMRANSSDLSAAADAAARVQ